MVKLNAFYTKRFIIDVDPPAEDDIDSWANAVRKAVRTGFVAGIPIGLSQATRITFVVRGAVAERFSQSVIDSNAPEDIIVVFSIPKAADVKAGGAKKRSRTPKKRSRTPKKRSRTPKRRSRTPKRRSTRK